MTTATDDFGNDFGAMTPSRKQVRLNGALITAADIDLTFIPKAIFCNTAGVIWVKSVESADFVPFTVVASQILDVRAAKIGGTTKGTTVTDIILMG